MSERSKAAFEASIQELWAWRKQNKRANFRTIEERVEQEMTKLRAVMLSELAHESVATSGETEEREVVSCPKYVGRCQRHGRQQRKLAGCGGAEVDLKRQKVVCQVCGHSFSPMDEQLELVRYQRLTPWLAECMVRLRTELPFERAREELHFQQGVEVSRELIRRHTEAAGAVHAQLQADTPNQTLGSVAAHWTVERAGERMMVSVDAAKVQTVSGEGRSDAALATAQQCVCGE